MRRGFIITIAIILILVVGRDRPKFCVNLQSKV